MFDTHPECVVRTTRPSVLVLFPSVVAVVRSACGSCFLWCGPYIVESAELMSGITPDNSDSDSTPELLEHDREGAALAVCIDKWRNSQPMVSGRSFARQASDNLIEVFSNFAESPRDERYDLLS